jgi:hypothetical protein
MSPTWTAADGAPLAIALSQRPRRCVRSNAPTYVTHTHVCHLADALVIATLIMGSAT